MRKKGWEADPHDLEVINGQASEFNEPFLRLKTLANLQRRMKLKEDRRVAEKVVKEAMAFLEEFYRVKKERQPSVRSSREPLHPAALRARPGRRSSRGLATQSAAEMRAKGYADDARRRNVYTERRRASRERKEFKKMYEPEAALREVPVWLPDKDRGHRSGEGGETAVLRAGFTGYPWQST